MCDACAMGPNAKACDRPIYKVWTEGWIFISYCKEAWENEHLH